MNATAIREARFEFAPPQAPALGRSLLLAVLAHGVLLVALMLGVQWRNQVDTPAIEAELWSALPQAAAPRAVEPPAPEQPAPPPPAPQPTPVAPPPPQPVAEPPATRDAEIAVAREKQRLADEEKRRLEALALQKQEQKRKAEIAEKRKKEEEIARKEVERKALERQQAEKAQREKLAQEKQARDKAEREKTERIKAERDKAAAEAQKQADARKRKDQQAKEKAEAEAKALEAQRQSNLKRMTGLAGGGTGAPDSTGTAARASGPSASYAGRVVGRVKPNIVFPDEISGNPVAVVEVRTAPDGTIVGKRLVKSSGNKAWDDAVLKALDKTETLPRDEGRPPPSPMEISFRPRD